MAYDDECDWAMGFLLADFLPVRFGSDEEIFLVVKKEFEKVVWLCGTRRRQVGI